jgi:hypothetical protein
VIELGTCSVTVALFCRHCYTLRLHTAPFTTLSQGVKEKDFASHAKNSLRLIIDVEDWTNESELDGRPPTTDDAAQHSMLVTTPVYFSQAVDFVPDR